MREMNEVSHAAALSPAACEIVPTSSGPTKTPQSVKTLKAPMKAERASGGALSWPSVMTRHCPWWAGDASEYLMVENGTRVLMTAVVAWLNGDEGATYQNEGVHVFTSAASDTMTWQYRTTVAKDRQVPGHGEGPSENSLARLADGKTLLAVVRFGAGDGGVLLKPTADCDAVPSVCYTNYMRYTSTDEGRTWSGPRAIANAGSARPRLLMLGNGKGPLLLSGGRSVNRGKWDITLWVSHDGMGEEWEEYSLTYRHNALVANASLRYDGRINTTEVTSRVTAAQRMRIAEGSPRLAFPPLAPPRPSGFLRVHFAAARRRVHRRGHVRHARAGERGVRDARQLRREGRPAARGGCVMVF